MRSTNKDSIAAKKTNLLLPYRRQNEEKFDEYDTKWQNTAHQHGEDGLHVPDLFIN
jgi:hypothetical protein